MAIQRVGVVGCGLMGAGIAQVCAQSDSPPLCAKLARSCWKRGLRGIEKNLARLVEKGTITEAARNEIRGRLKGRLRWRT